MQNKGALTFLTVVLAIACAYQLSFTFVTRHVEKKAAQYASGDSAKEQHYIDSIKSQTVYNLGFIQFNYRECKEKEINLGLDLRGGMNVMLEISTEDILRALSNDSKDPIFNQALVKAREGQKSSTSDYITLFAAAYDQLSNGGRLSEVFNTPNLREKITPASTNEQVIRVLRDQANSAIENSYSVLRSRIDRFGVVQPNIQRLENSGRILVELPGVKEPERVRKLLQGTASLEFWATYDNADIYPMLVEANGIIKELKTADELLAADTTATKTRTSLLEQDSVAKTQSGLLGELDSLNRGATDSLSVLLEFPLFAKLSPAADMASGQIAEGPVVGHALAIDTVEINRMLNLPQVKGALLPRDLKLMWGVKAINEAETIYALYAIKANTRDGKPPLDGGVIVDAREEYAQQGASAEVSMVMNPAGARTWARLTADNIHKSIAIVLDGYVYSAPRVNQEITGGRSSITGDFTINEARDLANVLKSGKLPAPARIIQDTVVGPSLGQESISAGMISFIFAFILVLIYMIFFYSKAGMVASVALICNLFFLLGVLASFGAVLTLPGIAGIVLTMGMAVDANVIIYERVKEELRAGNSLSVSVSKGYHHAMSAIIDCNLTTLITGVVLFIFGTGPVQGFATTLVIGVLTSFFTSVFVSRIIFTNMLSKGKDISFSTSFTQNFMTKTKIDFISMRRYTYIISGILILATIVSLATRGLNYGVDFSGGRAYVVRFDSSVTDSEVRDGLAAVFTESGYEVKQFGKDNQMRIVTQYKYDDDGDNVAAEIDQMLYKALNPLMKTPLSEGQFSTTLESAYGIVSSDKVGPSVAYDIKVNSLIAILVTLSAIALYIVVRFKSWYWGVSSAISLTHDGLLTIGLFSLLYGVLPFNLEVNQSFIAAVLMVIGFSINDKVVIFDRIREYRKLYPTRQMRENINNAINSTLSRTINTSGTALVVLLAIFFFGGEVIRGFVFALLFGVIIGTLSSIFVATPVAYDMMKARAKRTGKTDF